MPTVDERIVSMQFDNNGFAKGVEDTEKALDDLNKSLSNINSNAFNELQKSAEKTDLSSIHAELEKINIKIPDLNTVWGKTWDLMKKKASETIAHTIGEMVTFDDGFKEYEEKMDSVQTIMNSSGASLEEVNKYLEELNVYADKTIYSFSDMTSSIGKFTNAGVDLEDAVAAIQGVSNVAALAGANSNQAGAAMYNFAQALSSGAVKLIDWKSIENANMATVEFKNELIKTAEELGTLNKVGDKWVSTTVDGTGHISEAFDATSNFNDSLSAAWMTSDVLTTTLAKFADETTDLGKRAYAAAQDVKTWSQLLDTLKEAIGSGWSQSFEIIIGNFEEAKELFTIISDRVGGIIDRFSNARNAMLQMWKDKGGRDKLIQALNVILDSLVKVYDWVDQIFGFLQTSLSAVEPFTSAVSKLSKSQDNLTDSTEKLTDAERKFAEEVWLYGTHGNGQQRIDEANKLGISYENMQGAIEQIIAGTYDWNHATKEANKENQTMTEQMKKARTEFEKQKQGMKFAGATDQQIKMTEVAFNISEAIKYLFTIVKNLGITVYNVFQSLKSAFLKLPWDIFTADISRVIGFIAKVVDLVKELTKEGGIVDRIIGLIGKAIGWLYNRLSDILNVVGDIIGFIYDKASSVIKFFNDWATSVSLNETLQRGLQALKNILQNLKDVFIGFKDAIVKGIDVIKKKIIEDPVFEKLREQLSDMKKIFSELVKSVIVRFIEQLERISGKKITIETITDAVVKLGEKIADLLIKGLEKLSEWFDIALDGDWDLSWIDTIANFFIGIGEFIQDAIDKIGEFFSKLTGDVDTDALGAIKQEAAGVLNGDEDGVSSIKDRAKEWVKNLAAGLWEGIKEFISTIDWKTVVKGVKVGGFIAMVPSIIGTMNSIKDGVETVSDTVGSVGDIFSSVSEGIGSFFESLDSYMEAQAMETKSNAFFKIAEGIAIIAFSLIALTDIDTNKLMDVVACLILIGAVIAAIITAHDNITNNTTNAAHDNITNNITNATQIFNNVEIKTSDFKIAAMIIAFAALIGTVASAILKLSDIPTDKLWMSIGAIAAMLAVVSGLLIALSYLAKDVNPASAVVMIGMVLSIKILLTVISSMIKVIDDNGIQAVGIAAGIILAVMTLMVTITQLVKRGNPNAILATGVAFVAIAAAMLIFIPVIGALAALSLTGGLGAAIGGLVALIVAIGLVCTVIAKVGAAVQILIFAGAMIVLVGALALAGLLLIPVATGLTVMAAALAVFAAFGLLLIPVAPILQATAQAILILSVAGIIGAVGFLIISIALKIFAEALPPVANAVVEFCAILLKNGPIILQAIAMIVKGLARILLDSVGMLGAVIAALLMGVLQALWDMKEVVFDNLVNFIFGLLDLLLEIIEPVVEKLIQILIKTINWLAIMIVKYSGPLTKALWNVIKSLGILVLQLINNLIRDIFGDNWVSDALTDGFNDIQKKMEEENAALVEQWEAEGKEAGEEAGDAYGTEYVDAANKKIDENSNKLDFSSLTDGIKGGASSFGEGMDVGSMVDFSKMSDDSYADFKAVSEAGANGYIDGGTESLIDINGLGFDMSQAGVDGIDANTIAYGYAGEQDAETYAESMNNQHPQTEAEGKAMSEAGADGALAARPMYQRAALRVVNGFTSKIYEMRDKVVEAGNDLAHAFINATEVTFDIRSPSRVMAGIGEYVVKGFVKGINQNDGSAEDASKSLSETVVDSIITPLDYILALLDGTLEYDPTIRPTLDTTQLERDVARTNGLFGNKSISLGSMTADLNSDGDTNSNADVVNAINELRNDIDTMNNRIENMQIVMDSGALVGQIAGPMDDALGRRQMYKGRRN